MKAGRLNRQITIQRKSDTKSASGHPTPTWSALAHRRPASVAPVKGTERYGSGERQGGEQATSLQEVEFQIRYSQNVADLSTIDRIVYPSPSNADEQTPPATSIYDIIAVIEIGMREGLQVIATRRPDTTP